MPGDPKSVTVLKPHGHVRMGDAVDQLRAEIDDRLEAGQARILIDMGDVKSLDSSAIGVLVRSLSLAKQQGGSIRLLNVPEAVGHTLEVTGILRLFDVFNDEATAVASFAGN